MLLFQEMSGPQAFKSRSSNEFDACRAILETKTDLFKSRYISSGILLELRTSSATLRTFGWEGRTITAGLIGPKPGYTYIGGAGGGCTGIPPDIGRIIIGGRGPPPNI